MWQSLINDQTHTTKMHQNEIHSPRRTWTYICFVIDVQIYTEGVQWYFLDLHARIRITLDLEYPWLGLEYPCLNQLNEF